MKICTGVNLVDLIMDAKFKFEKNSGILMSLGGCQSSPSFCTWALPQCSATALPVNDGVDDDDDDDLVMVIGAVGADN